MPALDARDIDIGVHHVGVYHSDLSMLDDEWGISAFPLVGGHEVIGRVAEVGVDVTSVAVGDIVGLGWHAGYCMTCDQCMSGHHNACPTGEMTIVGRHGGFADRVRAREGAVIKLPDGLDPKDAGPLLCGGVTVFNPIATHVRPTDRVGVVGIGGLGHLAVKFLKAWGCGTMMLAYNERYRAGDGCMVNNADKVTLYGCKVIDAMHRNGVILDLSHAAEATALSAIEYSQKVAPETPVVYTHGVPDAICDYVRSSTDAEIQACAATGGVFTLTMLPWLTVSPTGPGAQETKPEQVVEALDYIRNLVGIDHMGLSSDDTYSWPGAWQWAATVPEMYQDGGITMQAARECPTGAAEPAKIYPAIVDGLWANGYTDEDVAKILGGNIKRLVHQIWC